MSAHTEGNSITKTKTDLPKKLESAQSKGMSLNLRDLPDQKSGEH